MGCVEINGKKSFASLLAILGSNDWSVKVSQRELRILQSTEPESEKATAPTLAKAGRNEVDSALRALDEIPDTESGEIAVPWVIANRPKLDSEEWRKSVIQNVPIAGLLATQPRLTRKRVEFFVLNPGAIEEGKRAMPNVYHSNNERVIVDGHHRLAALWMLGADHANVWVLEGSQ
jgi:hypothetical protein